MFIRLSYALCLQFITINCATSYATDTKHIEVHNVNKAVEIYSNRVIDRNDIVQAKNTPVSINEKINVYKLPESQNDREDKNKVVSSFRDVEEIEPLTFIPNSRHGVNGDEWFGKGLKEAPSHLRILRSVVVNQRPETPPCAAFDSKTFYSQDSSLNIVADFVIDIVRQQIVKRGEDQFKVPDIHETFHKGIGSFDAVDGWFRNLASLRRTTDITVSRKGDILSVEFGMGLASMVLGYKYYKAKYIHIGPTGNIRGEVDHNILMLELVVDITNADCKISLHKLYFKEFSKLKINITGLGKLNWIFSKIVTWITNKFRGEIVHSAENILKETIEEMLSGFHC